MVILAQVWPTGAGCFTFIQGARWVRGRHDWVIQGTIWLCRSQQNNLKNSLVQGEKESGVAMQQEGMVVLWEQRFEWGPSGRLRHAPFVTGAWQHWMATWIRAFAYYNSFRYVIAYCTWSVQLHIQRSVILAGYFISLISFQWGYLFQCVGMFLIYKSAKMLKFLFERRHWILTNF